MSSEPCPPSDEELLQRFTDGDAAAFEALLHRYERPIYNFLFRSVGRRDRAEDMLQEVFLRVIQKAEQFQGNSKFSTWLYTIARNLCIDTSRKMAHRRHASLDAPSGGPDGPPLVDRVAGRAPPGDREALAAQIRTHIAHAVEELPDDQKEVFLMRHTQHMPFKEIAAVVGTSENTVKSRMRYALERLQQALAEYEDYVSELK